MVDLEQIKNRLPQRFPFLMIDKVILMDPPNRIVAMKNVTVNEPFFQGHFPDFAIMPGVLITEAMAQATIFFFKPIYNEYYLTSINIRFLNPVEPGDQIIVEAVPLKLISEAGIFKVKASVYNKTIARGELGVKVIGKKNSS